MKNFKNHSVHLSNTGGRPSTFASNKAFLWLTFGAALVSFVLLGCQKEDLEPNENNEVENAKLFSAIETESAIYYYRLDEIEVDASYFSVEDSTLEILITGDSIQNGKEVFVIHAFTTLERYLVYGDSNNIPLRKAYDAERHLADYAETSGQSKRRNKQVSCRKHSLTMLMAISCKSQ